MTRPIDPRDLLVRREVVLDRQRVRELVAGKRVLITGGGGFIGQEICRQCRNLGGEIFALDHSEFGLYQLGELVTPVIADVRDPDRIDEVFAEVRPEVVFHAAALKHVPLLETHDGEAAYTNIHGSIVVAETAAKYGARICVLISTDKAVEPLSVMGATKRHAENQFCGLDESIETTRFTAVRFGNVIGSTGSVIPLFQEQIARGGPVTVTHPDMERYFMTVGEAVELVLQAAGLALERDNRGELYVLDMGAPLKVLDIARDMIRLAGLMPGEIELQITGVRPGERMTEPLTWPHEVVTPTDCPMILAVM